MDSEFIRDNGQRGVKVVFHDDDGNPFDEVLTKQCFKDECDINNIIQRYRKTGAVPQGVVNGSYGDFSDIGTFQDACIKIEQANMMFDALPAKIRARFENDTGQFLAFADDPANKAEMIEMGLIDVSQEALDSKEAESVVDVKQTAVGSEQ